MKYIMFFSKARQQHFPFIFPAYFTHSVMAGVIRSNPEFKFLCSDAVPVSAGEYNDGEVSGDSETLKLKSRKEDSRIISMYNYFHGLIL